MTLDLPEDSPVQHLPWLITVGPMRDDDEWEPVVCGPYERPHALALAEAVVADEDLLAVVEPLLPLLDVEAIRGEVELARSAADTEPDADEFDEGVDAADESDSDDPEGGWHSARSATPPTADEIRAGFARIAAKLTTAG